MSNEENKMKERKVTELDKKKVEINSRKQKTTTIDKYLTLSKTKINTKHFQPN